MKVELYQQVEGKNPGDFVDVEDERGEWLVLNGYAVRAGGEGGDGDDSDARPPKSASKAEWVAYAVTQGVDEDEAESSTKDELIDRVG